ncbi:conserved hypothetical protein [Thioalkalivibrio sulfidiphilus HL-EbGr7]|uniref:PilZ domain-containing protein n=1 Tax=Thioalkalivibrio sulfidiphilus (strain HL-EbGR7) TaxID=396588 RepID=B8GPW8_THISH|nr:PilZ domain-containing protein [Thioalkalivibrio sulfidiphilus]ACL74115.1 conserved hypothetical protein [Thioalkalivibrio sulfidiphilus HL-EbGr7]
MNTDRRRHPRIPMEVEVELHVPAEALRVVRTRDLSGSGVLLLMPAEGRPAIGARVQVRVVGALGDGDAPPLVPATVVRDLPEGVAVAFEGC